MKVETVQYECYTCTDAFQCGLSDHGPALVRRVDVIKWLRWLSDKHKVAVLNDAADALEGEDA